MSKIVKLLRNEKLTIKQISVRLNLTQRDIKEQIKKHIEDGVMIENSKNYYYIPNTPVYRNKRVKHKIDKHYSFGFCGDSHLCSKYERLDLLNKLYDRFEEEGLEHVYHTGNWIDGEAKFNIHDIHTHGIDEQIKYLVDNYPERDGITTYAVAGDDHEGWYTQKFGIDIGKHAERIFREHERLDWVDLGYMESVVELNKIKLMVMHPGGGSAYAISYRPQKIAESFREADKPDILLIGHYHKLSYNMIREIHAIQTGCHQEQTPFMRKKIINAHLGGGIAHLEQENGVIKKFQVEFIT
jgi:predicted phosphodiesterase/biotin operon repressor